MSANSRILEWLEKISEDLQSVKSIDSQSACATKNSVDLLSLLKAKVRGQLILSFHNQNGFLCNKSQQALCHIIVEHFIGSGQKMTYMDMKQWALAIVHMFPKEKVETYFLDRKKGSKNPTGKLFSRWANSTKLSNISRTDIRKSYDVEITFGMYHTYLEN